MTKRSFFLTVAAGLLASIAFASPSQAASTLVTTNVVFALPSGGTGTFSDISVTYSPGVDAISMLMKSGGSIVPITLMETAANTVHATFAATAGGSLSFTFETGTAPPIIASGFSFSGSASGITDTVTITTGSVPEPASLALLGIGMTGFLAFRRFFKKTAVA